MLSPLGTNKLGAMAQQISEDVVAVECADSTFEGYDFQVTSEKRFS